jgi:hypothetical protein
MPLRPRRWACWGPVSNGPTRSARPLTGPLRMTALGGRGAHRRPRDPDPFRQTAAAGKIRHAGPTPWNR